MANRAKTGGLTDRQWKFVRAYLVSGVGTKAAIEAGYSAHSARVQASALLTNPAVQEALIIERSKLNEKAGLSAENVRRLLAHFAYGETYKASDRLKALEQAAKLDGLNAAERHEVQVEDLSEAQRSERLAALAAKIKSKTATVAEPPPKE